MDVHGTDPLPSGAVIGDDICRSGTADTWTDRPPLLHRHALGQVAGLVDVGALDDRGVVGQQLDRDGVEDRRDNLGDCMQSLRRSSISPQNYLRRRNERHRA